MQSIVGGLLRKLRADLAAEPRRVLDRGDRVADFLLYDQSARAVRSKDLEGKVWVLNFIFTRCEEPTMCPAASARMVQLARELDKAGLREVRLLSITLDPDYDTPAIFRAYAARFKMDERRHLLLSGSPELVRALLRRFGILTQAKDGTLQHNMATFLIDKSGHIALRHPGSHWSPKAFFHHISELSKR